MKQIVTILAALIVYSLAFQGAQAFPDRPVKLVVASPAGGPPDVMARLLSDKMADCSRPACDHRQPAWGGRHDRSEIGPGRGAGRLHADDGKHELRF